MSKNPINKTIKKVKKYNYLISEKKRELREIDELVYYQTLGKNRKELDRKEIKIELKSLVSIQYGLLETLQQQIELQKSDLSYLQRSLITNF